MGAMPGKVGGKARKKLCASVTFLSRAVFNERATIKDNCFTKRNSMDIIAIGSFASEVEIVPLRASLEVTK